MSNLSIAILRTVVYFDIFDYPLTVEEVYRWLSASSSAPDDGQAADDTRAAIETLVTTGKLERRGAYYYLPGRESVVETRTERMARSLRLWRRAASTARFLELVPFVKMVAVVNTLAIDNVRPESDIDLLIITAPRHIWIARMIVSGIVSLLGYRRHGKKIAGRICLSFYATTEGMNFESLQSEKPDIHLAYWTAQAVPLLDDGTYEAYQRANAWVTRLLPQAWAWEWRAKLLPPNSGLRSIRQFFEVFIASPAGQWLESWAREYQLKRIDRHVESKAKLDTTDVVISEDVLKFHEADRRAEYNGKFQRRLSELGLPS